MIIITDLRVLPEMTGGKDYDRSTNHTMIIMGFMYFLRDVTMYRFIVLVIVTFYTILIYSIVNFSFL